MNSSLIAQGYMGRSLTIACKVNLPVHKGSMSATCLAHTVILLIFLSLAGCATPPAQTESMDYRARAETRVEGGVSVSAVVLSPRETEHRFDIPLAKKGIQPIWIEIDNQEDREFFLMLLSVDPEYFSPSEVAWMFRHQGDESLEDRIDMLVNRHIPLIIPAHGKVSGYVYTNLDPGAKAYAVEMFTEQDLLSFEFIQIVPGFEADFMRVRFEQLYPENEVQDLTLSQLREYLETLPCCVAGGNRKTPGDPLNLVIVGGGRHLLATFVRRGWDLTETMRGETVWRTVASSLFRSLYRTSPVSPLYLFDRKQDFALQKTRGTVHERNHLRLWLAPITLAGRNVWVGQISRDIGIKPVSNTMVTHKIDPLVDEARLYLTLDALGANALQSIGYVKGVGSSTREAPRYNYTKDPYYTDGLRVVLILAEERQLIDSIEYLPWEQVIQP